MAEPWDSLSPDEQLARLAGVARAHGLSRVGYGQFSFYVEPLPAPPPPPPREMTEEERKAAEEAGRYVARRLKLRKMLGREPTADEVENLP